MMPRCHVKHMIEPDKIRFVGFAQIAVSGVATARKEGSELPDPIRRCSKRVCRIIVTGARDVDPSEGVKAGKSRGMPLDSCTDNALVFSQTQSHHEPNYRI